MLECSGKHNCCCGLERTEKNIIVAIIFSFKSIFQKNENRFISLALKEKQQKGIQQPYIFLKFYINQFSNEFLLFLLIFLIYKIYSNLFGEKVSFYCSPDMKVI